MNIIKKIASVTKKIENAQELAKYKNAKYKIQNDI